MLKKKSFTLIELLIVVLIVGILAALALPEFSVIKERALDKEAKANLALIQAAEKIYRMEFSGYFPGSGTTDVISDINSYLKIALPTTSYWTYLLDGDNSQATATRNTNLRIWSLNFTGNFSDAPICSPNNSTCY